MPRIETVSASDAIKAAQATTSVIVDIRDPREIGARREDSRRFSWHRGMLEFWIDPASPMPSRSFSRKEISFTAPAACARQLAAKTAQDMGLKPVAHIGGGFAAWRDAGGPVEKFEPKKKG